MQTSSPLYSLGLNRFSREAFGEELGGSLCKPKMSVKTSRATFAQFMRTLLLGWNKGLLRTITVSAKYSALGSFLFWDLLKRFLNPNKGWILTYSRK